MLHTIYARNNQGAAIFTYLIFFSLLFGTPSQIRTENQQILNLSALPISVTGHINLFGLSEGNRTPIYSLGVSGTIHCTTESW